MLQMTSELSFTALSGFWLTCSELEPRTLQQVAPVPPANWATFAHLLLSEWRETLYIKDDSMYFERWDTEDHNKYHFDVIEAEPNIREHFTLNIIYLTRQVSLRKHFLFTMMAYTGQSWANCGPPYGTANHGQLWYSLESNQGVCSDPSSTEIQHLRTMLHSGAPHLNQIK
jgi:hypothetical protein